jgi:hypothetical protein
MDEVSTYETSDHFNVTTPSYIPKEFKLHACRPENLKSHIFEVFNDPKPNKNIVWNLINCG